MRPSQGQKADGHAGNGHKAGAAPGHICGKGSLGPLTKSPETAGLLGWRCPETRSISPWPGSVGTEAAGLRDLGHPCLLLGDHRPSELGQYSSVGSEPLSWYSRGQKGLSALNPEDAGGCSGSPTAWLLKRDQGAWSGWWGHQGWCRQAERAVAVPTLEPRVGACWAGPEGQLRSPPGPRRAKEGRKGTEALSASRVSRLRTELCPHDVWDNGPVVRGGDWSWMRPRGWACSLSVSQGEAL